MENLLDKGLQWSKNRFNRMINSIAFYPAVIAFAFLILSNLMITIDFSDIGKQLKLQQEWLVLKDASTARSIISVIAAGILSLTVFSFTMVMVILNQAASQMSNRVLDKLIGNRFQQIILGCYIGTIVYSLFLLSAIRDIDSGIYVPALSTYLLIAFAVVDIFLFIYFLHYITQSVKYAVIISRIKKQTQSALEKSCRLSDNPEIIAGKSGVAFPAPADGIYSGFDEESLLKIAVETDSSFTFLYTKGSYVIKDVPILYINTPNALNEDVLEKLKLAVYIKNEDSIETNYYYGFRQLTEVAVKALSPGINDPGTAVESLRSLAGLLAYRMHHFSDNVLKDDSGHIRVITRELSFDEIVNCTILPIWDYGKNDRFVQKELRQLLKQLLLLKPQTTVSTFLEKVEARIKQAEQNECK